jgi:Cdc6-like AAA superfamily ATPase
MTRKNRTYKAEHRLDSNKKQKNEIYLIYAGDVRAALKICQRAIEIYVEEKKELKDAEAVVGNAEVASEEEIMMLGKFFNYLNLLKL